VNVGEITKLAVYSYFVGLAIYIVLLFTPFALAFVWPLWMLSLILPLAGCWGVIPYPIVAYIVMSGHTTGVEGTLALITYYVVLLLAIAFQLSILIKALRCISANRCCDRILRIVSIHHMVTGVFLFAFFYVYPSLRDFQRGLNVILTQYLPLALLGAYGFLINVTVFVIVERYRSTLKKKIFIKL